MRNPSVSADPHHSPFLLSPAANHTLRTYLKTFCPTKTIVFCSKHTKQASTAALKTYLLQHAAIRALLRPVYNLLSRATRLAHCVTRSADLDDLERAFRGDARTAYLWYTCLEEDEAGWFWSAVSSRTMKLTIRCPGCVVDCTLHTETTIRLMLAACSLAQIRAEVAAEEAASCDDDEAAVNDDTQSTDSYSDQDAALAEVARCWAHAVEESLSHDDFWRPAGIRAEAMPRANVLAESMWCLEGACEEIEAVLGGFWESAGSVESPVKELTMERIFERQAAHTQRVQCRSVIEAFVNEWVRQNGEPETLNVDVEIVDEVKDDERARKSSVFARPPFVRARSITS